MPPKGGAAEQSLSSKQVTFHQIRAQIRVILYFFFNQTKLYEINTCYCSLLDHTTAEHSGIFFFEVPCNSEI